MNDDHSDGDRSQFASPGSALRRATKRNPRNLPCPTCKQPNKLTPADVRRGYQCDACADRDEGLSFARGPYQPQTGERCHCRPGQHRDNCPDCEGTGMRIDFRAIRGRTLESEQAKALASRGIASQIIEAVARDDARAAGQIVERLRAIGVTYDEAAAMFASVCPKCERGEFEALMYRADEIANDLRQQKEDARGDGGTNDRLFDEEGE